MTLSANNEYHKGQPRTLLLIITSSDISRLVLALLTALAVLEAGGRVRILFTLDGIEALITGALENLRAGRGIVSGIIKKRLNQLGLSSATELFKEVRKRGAEILVDQLSLEVARLTRADLVEYDELVTPNVIAAHVLGGANVIVF